MYANGIESSVETNPNTPVMNTKNIVRGMSGRIKIFAGIDTIDSIPVEYNSIGSTAIVAPSVVATSSRNPKRIGINFTQPITLGVIKRTPNVAIKESWNDISVTTLGS
jgi:hypothetical protein